MGFLDNLGLGGEIASAGINLAGGAVDLFTRKKRREEQFAREDNAAQRRADDLQAAGLSRTLAAGSAASAAPVSTRSTQTKVGISQAILSNAQKELTSAKISESASQTELNKSATGVNIQRANQIASQTISQGVTREGQISENVLRADKAKAIPLERAAFNALGWSYYKDAHGMTGEIARSLATFASGTTGLAKEALTRVQPIVEWAEKNISLPIDKLNREIDEKLRNIPGMVGTVVEGTKNIIMQGLNGLRNIRDNLGG